MRSDIQILRSISHFVQRVAASLLLLVLTNAAIAVEPSNAEPETEAVVAPREPLSAYFGGEEVHRIYTVTSERAQQGTVRYAYAAGERTLGRGETPLGIEAGGIKEVVVSLQLPPVREGVIFPTTLKVTLHDSEEKLLAESEQTIWLFPRDPFVERREWLKGLKISLYDPEESTGEVFSAAEIPFEVVHNPGVLESIEEGVLIIGEGVSLASRRGLAETMATLAQRGVLVVCLAPADGTIPWPENSEQTPLRSVAFHDAGIIQKLDKRLDVQFAKDAVRSGLTVTSVRGGVRLEVSDAPNAWPWWRVEYSSGGRWIVCGFGLVEHWDEGPTPRFLLARILEQLDPNFDADADTDNKNSQPSSQEK